MAMPPIGRARRVAKQRFRAILLDELAAEITAAVAADDWDTVPAMPEPTRVFLCPPEEPDAAPRNSYVFAYVYEDGPRITEATTAEGNESARAQTVQDIRVVIAFTATMKACANERGETPPPDEEMRHRADLYCEAVAEAILKHGACCDEVIASVDLIEDLDATVYLEDMPVIGACSLLFRVTQFVAIPNRVCA